MTNTISMIFAGCMLLISTCIPIKMIGQELAISGDGQLRVIPSLYGEGLVIYDNMLPHYKPMTKSVIIKRYDLRADQGELKRDYTHVGDQGSWRTVVSYDRQGNVVEVNDKEISLKYANNKIVEINKDRQPGYKYSYDSKGHLESAVSAKDTYKYNVDTKGNITSVKEYFGVKMSSTAKSMSYDNQHRMTAYHEVGDFFGTPYSCDYRWIYDKKGNLTSYKRIYHKNGRKTEDLEYQFEFDAIGNPTRCIKYIHGDITIIDCGYEYEYTYSFYLSPEELDKINYENPIDIDYVDVRPSYPNGKYPNGEINFQIEFFENMKWYNTNPDVKELLKNGEIVVGFVVEPDGAISNVKVITKEGDLVDEEIERTILSMQKWEPGWIDGHKVRVAVRMPIKVNIQH